VTAVGVPTRANSRMTESRDSQDAGTIAPGPALSAGVLADRMAAALLHHEPGWRLPRHTALARRYNVTTAEIDAAIDLLARRHLLTRLPDGHVFRTSPAEYRLTLEGLPGLATRVDPMGGQLACKSRNIARRRAAEDVARVLGTPPGQDLLTVRCLWTVGGEPAAYTVSYLSPEMESLTGEQLAESSVASLSLPASRPRAFQLDFQAPAPSVARTLRLPAGAPAATLTVRFEDGSHPGGLALTVAVLRPELFRIVVESSDIPGPTVGPDGPPGGWTDALGRWEP
jgi:DNA-binding GntR family transcriptional regulator